MTIVGYDPFHSLARFQHDMARLFGNGWRGVEGKAAAAEYRWTPAIDIREDDNGYVLSADLPGVRRDDVDITMDRNRLTIRGKRETAVADENGELLQSERAVGTFYRQFTLPETVAKDSISAKYENGVLEVVLPKEAAPQPRRIAVAG